MGSLGLAVILILNLTFALADVPSGNIVESNQFPSSNSNGNLPKLFQKLTEVVEFSAKKRTFPTTTIRIISSTNKIYSILESWESSFVTFPIVRLGPDDSVLILTPHSRKNHTVTRYDLYTFITIVVIEDLGDFELFQRKIRPSVDPRRDFLIFVAGAYLDGDVLEKIKKLGGFRNKVLIDGLQKIWVEPIIYNGGMIKVPSIHRTPQTNPMGENLRGKTIKASAPETPPFNFKSGTDPSGKALVDGSLCRIFVEASKKFNFTPIIDYAGFDYGTLHPNGTWTGSYSKIHYPDSGYDMDLIVSSELLWTQLDVAVLATSIDMIFGVSFPTVEKHWYAFLLPFDPEVWMWTFIMFFFLGGVQGIVMYLMSGRELKPIVIDSTGLLPFAISMEQGLQDIPVGMRYFSLILLMGCTVLGTGYKSTLRTHLMFPKPDPVPTTFDELADRTDFAVALAVYGELEKHFWATSEVRAVRKIRERLTFESDWGGCYKKAFLMKKQACISWMNGKYIVGKGMTLNLTVEPLVYSKDAAIRKFLSLGFQENSIYVDSFSRITGTPASMGIVRKWEEEILNDFKKEGREKMLKEEDTEVFKRLVELAQPEEDAVPLQLESLVVVLGFIPAGGILGMVAFLWELKRYKKESREKGGSGGNAIEEEEVINNEVIIVEELEVKSIEVKEPIEDV